MPGIPLAVAELMRRRTWVLLLSAVAAVVTALTLVLLSFVHPEALRERMELFLTERLDSDVEIGDFGAHPLPTLSADGSDLVLRRHGDACPVHRDQGLRDPRRPARPVPSASSDSMSSA